MPAKAKKARTLVLSEAKTIPLDKLTVSASNVRVLRDDDTIAELANDIARRTLLQSLSVRETLDGTYEVQAGGRRLAALHRLVAQKRLAKDAPVPCIVRHGGVAAEDSLAENAHREDLHPLDQYRAFKTLVDKGLAIDDIAATFCVTPVVVKQRLKLAAISPKLLDIYAADGMSLEQLIAFSVVEEHARQELVWDSLPEHSRYAHTIRRRLTEKAVSTSDRRLRFVGLDAFEAAGGAVMRDLFDRGTSGYVEDIALLETLALAKLQAVADKIKEEGWLWVETHLAFSYGLTDTCRQLDPTRTELTAVDAAEYDRIGSEIDKLRAASDADDTPLDESQRLEREIEGLEHRLRAIEQKKYTYDPADMSRAGVIVAIDQLGWLDVRRGYVRSQDEPPALDSVCPTARTLAMAAGETAAAPESAAAVASPPDGQQADDAADSDTGDSRPLSERLVGELTTAHTIGLRAAIADDFDVAFLAVLHALCLATVYRQTASCLDIRTDHIRLNEDTPGLADMLAASVIDERRGYWRLRLPHFPNDLWTYLRSLEPDQARNLFAYCTSLTVNAVEALYDRNRNRRTHAAELATALELDMTDAGWEATRDTYLSRVPKAKILEAVREALGDRHAQMIEHLKKSDMAIEASRLLAGTRWLPAILRTLPDDDTGVAQRPDAPVDTGQETDTAMPEFLADLDGPQAA